MKKPINNTPLFFIAGRIRSGTTLLNRILNRHSDIFIPQESPFIMHLYKKYKNVKQWDKNKIDSFYNDLWKEGRIKQFWKLDNVAEDLKAEMLALDNEASFQKLVYTIFKYQAINRNDKEAIFFGDKNPGYTLYLNDLIKLFPDSKFILLIRDARSNILSCQNVSFDLNDTAALAERWNYCAEKIYNFNKKYPKNSLIVRFEDLLTDEKNTLLKICDFLKISYQEQLFEIKKEMVKLESWKTFTDRPLEKDKSKKWKTQMDAKNITITEVVSKKWLKHYNYEILTKKYYLVSYIKLLPNIYFAKILNLLEKIIYYFPLWFRVNVINFYRKKTKTS